MFLTKVKQLLKHGFDIYFKLIYNNLMTEKEFEKIFNLDNTHKIIYSRLGEDGQKVVKDIMLKLPADEFSEINPNAEFDITDIPIPQKLLKQGHEKDISLTKEVESDMGVLLQEINQRGTNLEYPGIVCGIEGDETDYFAMKMFKAGDSQGCKYDWGWIEDFVKNPNNEGMNLAIFHTHPNALDKQHKTLYNKYPEVLSAAGVEANGLNLSLSDVYVMQYLDILIEKHNAKINPQALVLMHNGELVSFSTKGGLKHTGTRTVEMIKDKMLENDE